MVLPITWFKILNDSKATPNFTEKVNYHIESQKYFGFISAKTYNYSKSRLICTHSKALNGSFHLN